MHIEKHSYEAMMNSYRQNTKQGRGKLYAATVLAIVLFFANFISGGSISSLVHMTGTSLWNTGTSLKEDVTQSGIFTSRAALTWANESLAKQVAIYQEEDAAYKGLQAENDDLRALVHLAADTPGITAPITSSFDSSPYGTFLIGAGSAEGAQVGSLVLTRDGFVLGKIVSVDVHQSTVNELFAPHTSINAKLDTSDIQVLGWGGGNARTTVPHGVTVAVGDPITVPSYANRSIGIVGKVIEDPSSAVELVFVYLPINRSSLDYVYVVKQK